MAIPEQLLRTIKEALDSAKEDVIDLKKIASEEEYSEFVDAFAGYNPDNFLIIKDQNGYTKGFLILGANNQSIILYLEGDKGVWYISSAYNMWYKPPEGLVGVLVYVKNEELGEMLDSYRGCW